MTTQDTEVLYNTYKEILQKAADLQYASAVLGWDQEVYMPAKGFDFRGRQMATLATQAHEMVTSEKFGALLQQLTTIEGLDDNQAANVRLSVEDYEKNKKLPSSFIDEITRQTSDSYSAWIAARKQNDYSIYAPQLEKMIELKRKQAELYGYNAHPYDALMDDYEKGATVAMLDPIFDTVKEKLPQLLKNIAVAGQVDDSFMHKEYPKQQQWDFSVDVLKAMGYDMEAGRQDLSEHPFTTSFSPQDVRITTRVDEHNYASLLWSTIHEGGHALYEQGLPVAEYGMPLGAAASLAIHESQSRLWENNVGRSYEFWSHFYPMLQQYFPKQLFTVSLKDFYKGQNKVASSLVRTEADEVTYHFHVLIRYEIEKGLIDGSIAVKDLRERWNGLYQKYIGITPPDDKTGVLQDVHWAHGSFGYFPTYSLGSFYAAQFYEQAQKELFNLPQQVADGQLLELLAWLRKKVHAHGRKYRSEELCERITGRGLDVTAFMRYLNHKYLDVYDMQ